MSRQHHYLKTETKHYQDVEKGIKTFELRKNDRNFAIGDMVYLRETVNGEYTGRELSPAEIVYIFHGGVYGLDPEYCILQLSRRDK